MPYRENSAVKVAELSWDAFPEPSPKSESWQPDPDSIPVAGRLSDTRFDADTSTVRQRTSVKRDMQPGLPNEPATSGISSQFASTPKTTTPARVGSWPIPVPRVTGAPRAITPAVKKFTVTVQSKTLESIEAAPSSLEATLKSGKGTVKNGSARSIFRRPCTPTVSVGSDKLLSPVQTPIPPWASSLAHLLDDSPPALVSPTRLDAEGPPPDPSPCVLVPPHLRKQKPPGSKDTHAGLVEYQMEVSNLPAVGMEPIKATSFYLNAPTMGQLDILDFHEHVGAVRREATRVENADSAVCDSLQSPKEVQRLELQKNLLRGFLSKKSTHQRYLDAKLIVLMEDDMDLPKRTTRQELHNVDDTELDDYLSRTTSIHKLWWDLKQKSKCSEV